MNLLLTLSTVWKLRCVLVFSSTLEASYDVYELVIVGEAPMQYQDRLSMFMSFSVELANSANFISEIAGFLCVLCVDKSYQALNNT